MNRIFYTLLKCSIAFSLVYSTVQAQSVDEPKLEHEIAPLYPNIERKFTKYNIDGRSLRTREILDRLGRVDSTAYYQYKNGRRNQKIGAGLVAGGGTFLVVGGMIGLVEALNIALGSKEENVSPSAVILMAGGGGLIIVGIVKSILGGEEKRKAIVTYNQIMNQKRKHIGFYMKPGLTGFSMGLRF